MSRDDHPDSSRGSSRLVAEERQHGMPGRLHGLGVAWIGANEAGCWWMTFQSEVEKTYDFS